MPVTLYKEGEHEILAFQDLIKGGEGVQSNQFLVIHGDHTALIDPGGDLTYTPLSMEIGRHITIRDLDYVIVSHQDPDIVASIDKWLLYTNCKVAVSERWERFLPHLVPGYMEDKGQGRYESIPDNGGNIHLGDCVIKALPAHFLHSIGNFSFYDPVSKILFSGDIGASIGAEGVESPVKDFEAHIPFMAGFHRRYMGSNKVARYWVKMVRSLDVAAIVPQHGRPFMGAEIVEKFLSWFEQLECGVDTMTQQTYQVP